MDLTNEQLHTLRHMLGINDPYMRVTKPYRDYAAVNPGDPGFAELERIGAVRKYRVAQKGVTDYHWYTCTEEGRLAAIRSHRTIRKTKAQRVYNKFLHLSDCCPDLTFGEFLTGSDFRQSRDEA